MSLLSLCFFFFSSVFLTPAKSFSRDMGQGREDVYRQGWDLILKVQSFSLNLRCPSSRQPKGQRQSYSSWHGDQLGNQVPRAFAFLTKDPASSNWVSTQPLRKVLTVLSSTHPPDPQEVPTVDRCCSYLFLRNQSTLVSLTTHNTYGMLWHVSPERWMGLGPGLS